MHLLFLMGTTIWDSFKAFDYAVYKFVSGFMSDGMTGFMKLMTFIGSGWSITALAAAIPFLVFVLKKRKYYATALLIPLNIAAGSLLNEILKQIFQRARPDILRLVTVTDYSFPSGHSMNSMIFYGFLAWLILKYVQPRFKYPAAFILSMMILLIGTSRVYLGVHYASDVIAGFIIGLAWLAFFIRITRKYTMESDKEFEKLK
ncbi:MAG TPA: phosphatase PAP2 family protein [Clostridia bacterium]|nr:phosphatase PAP2 family protein [Clostridia bacterium]